MAQVTFKKFGSNTAFGSFGPGDKLRTSDEFAAHLVQSGVADYVDAPAAGDMATGEPQSPEPIATPKQPKRKR